MKMVVTTRAINRAKLQSNRRHQQTNTQFLLQAGCLSYPQPTVSKHCKVVIVVWDRRSEDKTSLRPKKSVLVLVLQVWYCENDLATLVVIMIFKDTTTFQVLFIVSLFCAWNITTVEINSGVHLLKS